MSAIEELLSDESAAALGRAREETVHTYEGRVAEVLTAYREGKLAFFEAENGVREVFSAFAEHSAVSLTPPLTQLMQIYEGKIAAVHEWRGKGYIDAQDAIGRILSLANELPDEGTRNISAPSYIGRAVLKPESKARGDWGIRADNLADDVRFFDAAKGFAGALALHFKRNSEKEFSQILSMFRQANEKKEEASATIAYALLKATEDLVPSKARRGGDETHPLRVEAQAAIRNLFEVSEISEEPPAVLLREARVHGLGDLSDAANDSFRRDNQVVIRHCIGLVVDGRNGEALSARHALSRAAMVAGNEEAEVPHDWITQNGTTPPRVYEELLLAKA